MSKPINTCILGVGLAGLTFHAPFVLALPKLFTLHSVLERNPQSPGGKVHDRFGVSPKIHRTLEQVLDDPEVELVIVGTPNSTHYSFAKAALEAGKHVLVDKPVTATAEQATELGAIARSKGLVLYGFQNRRWDSDFLALKRLLALPPTDPQSLGTLVEFESHYDRFRKALKGSWKEEPLPAAGQTYDLGAHLIDQALSLFGKPESLTAFIQNIRGVGSPEVDDNFTIHLHYPRGSAHPHPFTAILRSHILSARARQIRFVVRGTQGTYVKYGLDIQEDQLKVIPNPGAILEDAAYGKEPESIWGTIDNIADDGVTVKTSTWPSTEPGQYIELFKNLGAAIRDGAEQIVKWEQATAVIEIVELAHQSAREGVTVSPASTIAHLKQEISIACPGNPRVSGQRIIWRGRYLVNHEKVEDLWKSPDDPRIVHLAVHPSAWSSSPPEIPPPTQTPNLPSKMDTPQEPSPPPQSRRSRASPNNATPTQAPHPLAFILSKHHSALAVLSGEALSTISTVDHEIYRTLALHAVESQGWTWPPILDEEFPPATEGGLRYERVAVDGQNFLSLVTPSTNPTPRQLHAFKVLSYTFTLLSIPVSQTVTTRSSTPQSVTIPPNINLLLQQMGLPQIRVAQNQNPNPNPNNPVVPRLRDLPLRPLLAPILLLLFRTVLLLYFVAPARKPIFGVLILAWMLYEIWRPIRNGFIRGLRAAAAAENQQNQPPPADQQPRAGAVNPPQAPRNAPGGVQAGIQAPILDLQAGVVVDALASVNVPTEERMISGTPGTDTSEPSLSHKLAVFFSLLLTTMHPAVWNARRVVLRQREGRIRTEANIREAPIDNEGEGAGAGSDNRTQLRTEYREQHNRRPRWIRDYMERVVAAEWVDDSD
ncbi:hypothetical protein C0991_005936 [Blastosporella zonata]|nr:hypothetical protein C0991_005936 [Blastosporella zonata]